MRSQGDEWVLPDAWGGYQGLQRRREAGQCAHIHHGQSSGIVGHLSELTRACFFSKGDLHGVRS